MIATSSEPIGGETTVIALDATLAATGRFPALDLVASGTMRPELLVGEAGAEAIARAREAADEAGTLTRAVHAVSRRCSARGGAARPCTRGCAPRFHR